MMQRSPPYTSSDLATGLSDSLTYLYGIVAAEAPDPPAELRGLDDGRVHLVRVGRVAAIASRVSPTVYSDAQLEVRMRNLQWVGTRGLEHERVVDWYAARCPIIPLSLLSLHEGEERAAERVRVSEAEYAAMLDRLAGHTEWGIKLWRREILTRQAIDRLSPSVRALTRELEDAPPGKRFLLERKRESMRNDEVRALSKRLAHETFSSLASSASRSRLLQLPSVGGGERMLLLHSVFFVRNDAFENFQSEVTRIAGSLQETGFEIEFTGPWPPYHFSELEDD